MKSKLLIISFAVCLFSPFFASAAEEVIINEIAWMGTKIEGIESKNWWRYEWLELYNNTSAAISLDGWKIELYRTELDWSLDLKGTIPTNGYFLIVSSDKISPNYDLNYSNLGGKFNNNGQKTLLKNNSGEIIDSVDCFLAGKWFAGDNSTKQTMERKNPQNDGNDANNWQTSQNGGGTPKAKNSSSNQTIFQSSPTPTVVSSPTPRSTVSPSSLSGPSPSPTAGFSPVPPIKITEVQPPTIYPSGIFINEILPSPEGPDEQEEWIELSNQNNFEVDLSGWKISDSAGKTTVFVFPQKSTSKAGQAKIKAGGFLILKRPETKITLNNEGDKVILYYPNTKITDQISFEKSPRAQSYNRTAEGWFWSKTLTPGAENIISKTDREGAESSPQQSDSQESFGKKSGNELASIGKIIPESSRKLIVALLIALVVAIFSAILILILKRKIKKDY